MFSPTLEVEAVALFLSGRFADVSDVVAIGTGEWSSAFAFRVGGRERVVRFGSFPEDYAKDRVAARFAGPALPIPEVHEIGDAFDGSYAISTRLHGEPFDALTEAGYRRVLPAVFRSLDAIRNADLSGTTGYGAWRPDGSAPYASWREMLLDIENDPPGARTHGWRARLGTVPSAAKAFREGLRALHELLPICPEDRYLIHADLMADNVRVSGDRVTAVVDWANAMYGDFLYDLARLTFWTPWFPKLARIDVREAARAHYAAIGLSVPDFEKRLRACQVHLGLEAQTYNAFTRRWEELERSGQRTLELARGDAS